MERISSARGAMFAVALSLLTLSGCPKDEKKNPPAAPTGVTVAVVNEGALDVAWTDASTNETAFVVEWSATDGGAAIGSATTAANATTQSVTGLTASTAYFVRVAARNGDGTSAWVAAAASATTAPAKPTGLGAAPDPTYSTSQLRASWTDASSDEDGFVVEWSTSSAFTALAATRTEVAGAVTSLATGLSPATTYFARVKAVRGATSSSWATLAAGVGTYDQPPAAATALALDAGGVLTDVSVSLLWVDGSTGASDQETGFEVQRSPDDGTGTAPSGTWTTITTLAADVTSYTDTGLTGGAIYWYRIVATNGNDAAPSNELMVTMQPPLAPAAPTGLAGVAVKATGITVTLTWTDQSDNETGFDVERADPATPTTWASVGTVAAGVVTFADTTAIEGSTYLYRVSALNSNAAPPDDVSVGLDVVTVVVDVPAAPTALAAVTQTTTSVTLTWTDNSSDETGFVIHRSNDGGTTEQTTQVAADAETYTDTVAADGTYLYWVTAKNGVGDSADSNTDEATTVTPAAITDLAVATTAPADATLRLTWTAATGATGYLVERAPDVAGVAGTFAAVGGTDTTPLAPGTTQWDDTGLAANTKLYYRVTPLNDLIVGGVSNEASATTGAPPAAPSALAATAQTASSISLSWSDNATDETGYSIQRRPAGTGTFTEIGTAAANATTFTDGTAGLVEGTAYDYQVVAEKTGYSDSAASNALTWATSPTAPTWVGVGATDAGGAPNSGAVVVAWVDNSGNETGYQVERRIGAGAWGAIGGVVTAAPYTLTDSNTATAGTYEYRVRALTSVTGVSSVTATVASITRN